MPYEGIVALVRAKPELAADLLWQLLHVAVPAFTEARIAEASRGGRSAARSAEASLRHGCRVSCRPGRSTRAVRRRPAPDDP